MADGSAEFIRKMSMLVKKDNLGFGPKSWRYAVLIDNRVIKKLWTEQGFGDNTIGDAMVHRAQKIYLKI